MFQLITNPLPESSQTTNIVTSIMCTERYPLQMDKSSKDENLQRDTESQTIFPHLNLAFQHQWIQAPYCLIEWRQPDPQFSEEHALLHTGTKPEDTNGKHK